MFIDDPKEKLLTTKTEKQISRILLWIGILGIFITIGLRGLYLDLNLGVIEFKFRLVGLLESTREQSNKPPTDNIPIKVIWKDKFKILYTI